MLGKDKAPVTGDAALLLAHENQFARRKNFLEQMIVALPHAEPAGPGGRIDSSADCYFIRAAHDQHFVLLTYSAHQVTGG